VENTNLSLFGLVGLAMTLGALYLFRLASRRVSFAPQFGLFAAGLVAGTAGVLLACGFGYLTIVAVGVGVFLLANLIGAAREASYTTGGGDFFDKREEKLRPATKKEQSFLFWAGMVFLLTENSLVRRGDSLGSLLLPIAIMLVYLVVKPLLKVYERA
jgi:hypothetical protein